MAALEFVLMQINPSLMPSPSTPPPSFFSLAATLKQTPGVLALYYGQVIEDATKWQFIIRWESVAANQAFASSPALAPLQAGLAGLVASPPILSPTTEYSHGVDAALAGPVTEVCTCWGVDEGFHAENMTAFANPVDAAKLPGFNGMARAEFDQPAHPDPSVVEGHASRIILGWDSKEAHMAHKGTDSSELNQFSPLNRANPLSQSSTSTSTCF